MNKEIALPEGTITRKVTVDRSRNPQKALDATGRVQRTNIEVVQRMPQGEGEEIQIYLVPFKKQLSSDQLEKEVENIGLKLVDPIALAALNEAEPEFAREYPNITEWRDENGKACFMSFGNRFQDGRPYLAVNLSVNDSGRFWFFGCVDK